MVILEDGNGVWWRERRGFLSWKVVEEERIESMAPTELSTHHFQPHVFISS